MFHYIKIIKNKDEIQSLRLKTNNNQSKVMIPKKQGTIDDPEKCNACDASREPVNPATLGVDTH